MSGAAPLERGLQALQSWSWHEARTAFEEALREEETPEALEGLGAAASWLDDAGAAIAARERAYRLYRDQGEPELAARVADDLVAFRGEYAVASGWLRRARRGLDGRPESPVAAWVDLFEAFVVMAYERDVPRALELAESAVSRGRRLGNVDAEMFAVSLLGLVHVSSGRFVEGMRMLDEAAAAAVSGEVRDPEASANVCCVFVTASARARDFDRLAQWSRHVMDVSQEWANRSMFSYPRTEHAVALAWWGRWAEAEGELLCVIEDMDGRPLLAELATLRLADLRRRQGRFDEAAALLERLDAGPRGVGIGHRTEVARAALAFDRGDPAAAAELAERYLRLVPHDDVVERVDGLEVLVRARLALGDGERAERASESLVAIAGSIPTDPIRAAARLATGLVAAANGDDASARRALEQASDLFERSGAPFETGRARVALARSLHAQGRPEHAANEARKAVRAFEALGAAADLEAAMRLQEEIGAAIVPAHGKPTLTRREIEVLRLVAEGRANDEIAAALVLSVRTVERHVSNIYAKIGATGRTARAVAATYAHTHSLT